MNEKRHTYTRPQTETCFEDAFVGCAGNEPLQPGSPWGAPATDDDFTLSDVWEF